MEIEKKVLANLSKCYSIAPLKYNNKDHILVAAEKVDRCILFDIEGNKVDTVWSEPGGVMSMIQVPNTNGQFLATHKFYSPNDSKEAKIIIATPLEKGKWEIRTLVDLPHVHRFDIINRNGVNYLIACTLKSGHEYKEDWSMPGKVYYAVLPDDLSQFNENNQLQLKVVKDNMLKNHGYYKVVENGINFAVISCEEGVFKFLPPKTKEDDWEIEKLIDLPTSDAVLIDIDEDGENELVTIAPFHGEKITIFKKENGQFKEVYKYNRETPFLHSIYGGEVCGKPAVIIGNRQGERNIILFTYNKEKTCYDAQIIDEDCGSANVYHYIKDNKDYLISTNREIDEIAMYKIKL